MDLRRANPNGNPTMLDDEVLGTFSVTTKSVPQGAGGFVGFDVSSLKLLVKPGEKFAAELRASDGASHFVWLGWNDDPYPGGESFERVSPNDWSCGLKYDLGLRTYVVSQASRLTIIPREIIVTRPRPSADTAVGSVRVMDGPPHDPNSLKEELARTCYSRGMLYQRKGDQEAALADYSTAIRLYSELAGVQLPSSSTADNSDTVDRLIEACTQLIRQNPDDANAPYGRGLAYQRKGQHSQAEADFAEAARISLEVHHARN